MSKAELKEITPLPWFCRPSAMFQRELREQCKERRREEFEVYLNRLVTEDAPLTRENYYFAFVFLELPIEVYKSWYLYTQRYSDQERLVKMQERLQAE